MKKQFIVIAFVFIWCCNCDFMRTQSCCDEPPPDFRLLQPPPGFPAMDHNHCPAFVTG